EGPPPGRFLAVSRSLTPTAHLFADPLNVRIDVVLNRERIAPDRVGLRVSFLPYRIVHGVSRSREDFDRFTRLTYRMELRCITVACVPSRLQSVLGGQEGRGERRTFRFKPARIVYDDPKSRTIRHLRRVWWPPLDAISGLSATDTRAPAIGSSPGGEFRATITPVLEPSYRMSPVLLGGVLLAAAAALLAFPAVLITRELRRRRPEPEEPPELPPLERALLHVEWARDRGDAEEQRGALEALAFELDAEEEAERAREVRALAWSEGDPPAHRVTDLIAAVRGADADT
ncbi:MAG: hypothetical protein ABIR67_00945, partial [Gaiellaceae bacterium]